jgi:hypothetical protein
MMERRLTKTRAALIAPCGLNCRLCRAYVRDKNTCPGCRGDDSLKSKVCVTCRIKNCEKIVKGGARYCFSCSEFPCERLSHLDNRYTTNYGVSVFDNLMNIKKFGIRQFVRNENERWACPECGEIICMHKPQCLSCGHPWRNKMK